MDKILEMRQKRAALVQQAREILDKAEAEKRELLADEEQQYSRIMDDVDKLRKAIEREERQQAEERELAQSQGTTAARKDQPGEGAQRHTVNPRGNEEYRGAFWHFVRHGRNALDHMEVRALQIGTDSEGGYLVPDEFERQLIQGLMEQNIIRGLATVITTSGDRNIPVVASHGSAVWTAEEGPFTESDESFAQVMLGAHKVATIMKVSEELLNDSAFNLERYITSEYARRIGDAEEAAFVNGNGVGKPMGIVQGATAGKVGAAGQTTSVTADDLLDVYHALKRPYRPRAAWLLNDSTVKAIRKLKDSTSQYIWQPGLDAGRPDTLLGRPVAESAHVPEMAASAKSILFGDYSYYWIADRQGRVFQRLNELYAVNGQVGFRAYQRVDGKLILAEAVVYYQNSAS
jgi:HK97 family phage major capsid protein